MVYSSYYHYGLQSIQQAGCCWQPSLATGLSLLLVLHWQSGTTEELEEGPLGLFWDFLDDFVCEAAI